MTSWRRTRLRELMEGLYDGPHATPAPSESGPTFLGIRNITEDGRLDFSSTRHISEEDYTTWTRRVRPQPGDIVFSYEATLNRYAIIPEGFRGCLGRRLALIRPDRSKVDAKFLYYYFFSPAWRAVIAQNTLAGSTVNRIPIANVPDFEVQIPSLRHQRAIAETLASHDRLIDNNLKRVRLVERMSSLLYETWFVHYRFPGYSSAEWRDTELGPVPSDWRVTKLGDAVELAYGRSLPKRRRAAGRVPVFGSSGQVDVHNESLVRGPGIIVGRKGNVGTVHWTESDFWPIDTVFYVSSSVSFHYLFFNLQRQHFFNSDAAVPGLNRNQAYSNVLLIPPERLLSEFDAFAAPAFRLRNQLLAQNELLNEMRSRLLPKLMSGELAFSEGHFTSDVGEDEVA